MMRFPKIVNNLVLLFHNLICIEVRTDWVLKMICIYNWRCLIMPAIGPEIPCHSHNQSDENVKPITGTPSHYLSFYFFLVCSYWPIWLIEGLLFMEEREQKSLGMGRRSTNKLKITSSIAYNSLINQLIIN